MFAKRNKTPEQLRAAAFAAMARSGGPDLTGLARAAAPRAPAPPPAPAPLRDAAFRTLGDVLDRGDWSSGLDARDMARLKALSSAAPFLRGVGSLDSTVARMARTAEARWPLDAFRAELAAAAWIARLMALQPCAPPVFGGAEWVPRDMAAPPVGPAVVTRTPGGLVLRRAGPLPDRLRIDAERADDELDVVRVGFRGRLDNLDLRGHPPLLQFRPGVFETAPGAGPATRVQYTSAERFLLEQRRGENRYLAATLGGSVKLEWLRARDEELLSFVDATGVPRTAYRRVFYVEDAGFEVDAGPQPFWGGGGPEHLAVLEMNAELERRARAFFALRPSATHARRLEAHCLVQFWRPDEGWLVARGDAARGGESVGRFDAETGANALAVALGLARDAFRRDFGVGRANWPA